MAISTDLVSQLESSFHKANSFFYRYLTTLRLLMFKPGVFLRAVAIDRRFLVIAKPEHFLIVSVVLMQAVHYLLIDILDDSSLRAWLKKSAETLVVAATLETELEAPLWSSVPVILLLLIGGAILATLLSPSVRALRSSIRASFYYASSMALLGAYPITYGLLWLTVQILESAASLPSFVNNALLLASILLPLGFMAWRSWRLQSDILRLSLYCDRLSWRKLKLTCVVVASIVAIFILPAYTLWRENKDYELNVLAVGMGLSPELRELRGETSEEDAYADPTIFHVVVRNPKKQQLLVHVGDITIIDRDAPPEPPRKRHQPASWITCLLETTTQSASPAVELRPDSFAVFRVKTKNAEQNRKLWTALKARKSLSIHLKITSDDLKPRQVSSILLFEQEHFP